MFCIRNYTDTEIVNKLVVPCVPGENFKRKPGELPCYNAQEPPNLCE